LDNVTTLTGAAIHLTYAEVEIRNSTFDAGQGAQASYLNASSPVSEDHQLSLVLVGAYSTLNSTGNAY
jgi:hypothetical protein